MISFMPQEELPKKIHFNLDIPTHKSLKLLAAHKGLTMISLLKILIEDAIKRFEKKRPKELETLTINQDGQ